MAFWGLCPTGKRIEEALMAAATVSTANVLITAVEHPLRNPNYRLWLIGGTISLLGDQFSLVALPWHVRAQDHDCHGDGANYLCHRDRCSGLAARLADLGAIRSGGCFWRGRCICRSCPDGLHALAVEARTTGRGKVGQPKHGADDHHCWSSSSRVYDQNAGRRMGLLRGCDQLPVYHWRIVEAAGPT